MARRMKHRKQAGVILFIIGILFVLVLIAALVWMLALQKKWTDFKIDFAEAAAQGAVENSVIVTEGKDMYVLHAKNCQWICSQIIAAKQLPFQRETPDACALTLRFPEGSVLELTGGDDNRVHLQFAAPDGQTYRFTLGSLAQWDTCYKILTEGFAYKNEPAA